MIVKYGKDGWFLEGNQKLAYTRVNKNQGFIDIMLNEKKDNKISFNKFWVLCIFESP